jgi:FAD/FMN-containing dehydrogenase
MTVQLYSLALLAAQNWGGTVAPAPLGRPLLPQAPEEVAAAVVAAAAAGRRVRAIGHGHTWTPMFYDADMVP